MLLFFFEKSLKIIHNSKEIVQSDPKMKSNLESNFLLKFQNVKFYVNLMYYIRIKF